MPSLPYPVLGRVDYTTAGLHATKELPFFVSSHSGSLPLLTGGWYRGVVSVSASVAPQTWLSSQRYN